MTVSLNSMVKLRHKTYFRRAVIKILRKEGLSDKLVEVTFVDPKTIKELNTQYRHKNSSTDVLSFVFDESGDSSEGDRSQVEIKGQVSNCVQILGDIYISVVDAKKNIDNGQSKYKYLQDELLFLLIHGICHLLGYDHNNDNEELAMNAKQQELLDYLNKCPLMRVRRFFYGLLG